MNPVINQYELSVTGRFFKIAKLRHEWCEFINDPAAVVRSIKETRRSADLLTFVRDICDPPANLPYLSEPCSLAALPVSTFDKWWDEIGFKTRNKVRKAEKSGVQLREVLLDDAFSAGVEEIYRETPVRQGRRFTHYGKRAAEIREELSSFLDRSTLVGAFWQGELIGFMKVFHGNEVLRTVHIIAKLSHREKCAMDALIAKGVELCEKKKARFFHYGSWTDGGVGTFREKHGFRRIEVPRYFVPLTAAGRLMLALKMHQSARDRLPKSVTDFLVAVRARWNAFRLAPAKTRGNESIDRA